MIYVVRLNDRSRDRIVTELILYDNSNLKEIQKIAYWNQSSYKNNSLSLPGDVSQPCGNDGCVGF